ncbi:MAG: hypothetical protein SFX18_07795 [Pirellulales bacterium]|nr:hypothetical protein [Pirellulales bacterium]
MSFFSRLWPFSRPKMPELRQLVYDHDQAARTYAEYVAQIPERYRYRSPLPSDARNGAQELREINESLQLYTDFYATPTTTADERGQLDEEWDLKENQLIPWPDEDQYRKVKVWLDAHFESLARLKRLPEKCDYISTYKSQELEYDSNFQAGLIDINIRKAILMLSFLGYAQIRERDWNAVQETISRGLAIADRLAAGKMYQMDFLVIRGICNILANLYDWLARHPDYATDKLSGLVPLYRAAALLPPGENRVRQVEFQEWGLSALARLPQCRDIVNQYLAIFGVGVVGQSEHPLEQPQPASEIHPDPVIAGEMSAIMRELASDSAARQSNWHQELLRFARGNSTRLLPLDRTAVFEQLLNERICLHEPELSRDLLSGPLEQFPGEENCAVNVADNWVAIYRAQLRGESLGEESETSRVSETSYNEYSLEEALLQQIGKPTAMHRYRLTVMQHRLSYQRFLCAIFERLHQRRPTALEEIVSSGIAPELPLDPYNNRPFLYCAQRGLLWTPDADGNNAQQIDRYFQAAGGDDGNSLMAGIARLHALE